MNKKYKITFAIPSLRAGGAERVMSFVAQSLNQDKFDVTLLVIGSNNNISYEVKGINVVFLEKHRVLAAFFSIFRYLNKNKPDIVISAISHLNTLMAIQSTWFRKIKFIGREASILSVLKNIQPSKRRYYPPSLTKRSYRFLDIIVCQSKDMANDMRNNFNVPEHKLRIINNPFSDNFRPKGRIPNNKIPKFVTVGSLFKCKGHDRILRALSKFDQLFTYTIIGDGSEANEILELANRLELKDKILHIPFTKEVAKYLEESDVFLQGSYVEGFPNALLESCAVGTPVLAYEALGGTNEIVEEGINGFIAKDETDFIAKLRRILKGKWNPKEVSNSVARKYNKNKIIGDYEDLFSEILKK